MKAAATVRRDPPLQSRLYRGVVHHNRREPVPHVFRQSLDMLYLDLDELDRAFQGRWLWSVERPNLASFRRADYLGDPERPLREAVLERVRAEAGRAPDGPVRLLTHVRMFGYVFNPVSFYYCFDRAGALDTVVAEITNTPWKERHAYVLPLSAGRRENGARAAAGPALPTWRFAKRFHVSPFMPMDQDYVWRLSEPGERLVVGMQNLQEGRLVFDAALAMQALPLTGPVLAGSLFSLPFMTGRVIAGIYWQALRLRLKGVPFHPHPSRLPAGDPT